MPSKPPYSSPVPAMSVEMLTPKEFAKALKISISFLAKARKRGDGQPFIRAGRSIRYFPLPKPK